MFAGNGDHQNIGGESGTGDDILEVHKDVSLGVKNRLSAFLPERHFTDGEIFGLTAKETEKQVKDPPKPTHKPVQDPKEYLQNQNEGPASIENARVCGPMQQNDRLHSIVLGCSALILGLSAIAVFYPNWFTIYSSTVQKDNITIQTVQSWSLWQVLPCFKNSTICYEEGGITHVSDRWVLGMWVLAEQVLSLMGISMTVINILLQILNMVSPIRQMILKNSCIILFILTALVFFVAGLLIPSWLGPLLRKNGSSLHVEPLGCGILLLNSVLCGVCGVIVHVHCSRGSGLLSFNTNFIYHIAAGRAAHPVFGYEHSEIDKTSWSFYQKLNRSQNNKDISTLPRMSPNFSEMETLLAALGEGMMLSKLKPWKILDRKYFIDPIDFGFYYTMSKIKNKDTRIPIEMVMAVREGEKDTASILAKQNKSLCFVVVVSGRSDCVYLKATNTADRDKWVNGLRYAMKKNLVYKEIIATPDPRTEEVFALADANKDGLVDVDEMLKLLPVLNIQLSEEAAMNVFKEGHKSKTEDKEKKPALNKEDFIRFYHILTRRSDLDEIFIKYSDKKTYMSTADIMNFLQNCQKEPKADEEAGANLVAQYERVASYRNDKELSFLGFEKYLKDESQELFNPMHRTVYQDMSKPMTHYFIASSCKTYLEDDQLKGTSKVEMYINALCKGCRCVELDVYDGPDKGPMVSNGHTAASKISFESVIKAINENAFKSNPYPVILSLKNHCSADYQVTMAASMEAVFGDKLWKSREISATPSPKDLMKKIIVKGKKLSPEDEDASAAGDVSDEGEGEGEDEGGEKVEEQEEKAEEEVDANESNSFKKIQLQPNLSRITTMKSERFENVETAAEIPGMFSIFSISENQAMELCSNEEAAFNVVTHTHLVQIYPDYSQDSSNYLPTAVWSVGCQMAALNYQTPGEGIQQNDGLFRNNGGCGYVLKPDFLLDAKKMISITKGGLSGKAPVNFQIGVISGSCLPKPTSALTSPFVKVKVDWGMKQSCSFQTKTVKNNGLNPQWNEKSVLKVNVPELAIVNFTVHDENLGKNIIAYCSLPFTSMRQGYRHMPLLDNKGERIPHSYLFVEVSIS